MKKIFINILLFLSYSFSLFAIGTKGKVLDKTDNQPILGAVVEVVSSDIKTVTNNVGQFHIAGLKSNSGYLKISSLGYIGSLIYLSDTTSEIIVLLEPSVRDLETVVVTASRSEKKLKDVPVITQVLYANKLQKSGLTTVGAALEKEVPGMDFSQFGLQSKSSFQGLNAKYILFLVDGERLAGEMDGNVDYKRLNLEMVERIEIVRGASSVLYGSNAIGGVINIITRKPTAKRELDANIYFSKYNQTESSVTFGTKRETIYSQTSFIYNATDGYDVSPDDSLLKTQDKMYNIAARQRLDIDISPIIQFTLIGNGYYKRVFDGLDEVSPSDHGYAAYNVYSKIHYLHADSSISTLSYCIDDYVNYDILYKMNDEMRKYSSDKIQNIKLLHEFNFLKHSFVVGTEAQYENLFSSRITGSKKDLFEATGFGQDEYKLNSNLSLIGGMRITYNQRFKYNIVPKITFMYKILPVTLRMSYGMGFRSPSLKDLYYDFDHAGMFHLYGNPELKPEKANYISFSVDYTRSKYYLTVNSYMNFLKDMINGVWIDPVNKINMYQNIDKAVVSGLDVLQGVQFSSGFLGNIGISMVRAINSGTNKQLYNIAPVSINASLAYTFSLWQIRHNIEVFDKFIGRREFEPVESIRYIDQPFQILRFTYSCSLPYNIYASFGVDNVLDKVMPGSLGNTSPGRRFFVSLRYSFKKY